MLSKEQIECLSAMPTSTQLLTIFSGVRLIDLLAHITAQDQSISTLTARAEQAEDGENHYKDRVRELDARIARLRAECKAGRNPKHANECHWGINCPDGKTDVQHGCSACDAREALRNARATTDTAKSLEGE